MSACAKADTAAAEPLLSPRGTVPFWSPTPKILDHVLYGVALELDKAACVEISKAPPRGLLQDLEFCSVSGVPLLN